MIQFLPLIISFIKKNKFSCLILYKNMCSENEQLLLQMHNFVNFTVIQVLHLITLDYFSNFLVCKLSVNVSVMLNK